MMDHHDLDKSQKFLRSYVYGIVDHHDDTNYDYAKCYPNLKGENNEIDKARLKVQFPRCSNMAIVLEEAFNCEITSNFFKQSLNNDNFYDFLIGVLIVDTQNFSEKTRDKWVEQDRDVAKKILDSCKRSSFFLEDNGEYKLNLEKDYEFHFESLKKFLADVKFDKDKNIELGEKALFNKDRKDYEIKNVHREHPISVSSHSLPVSLFYVKQKLGMEKLRNFLFDEAEKSGLHMMVILCKEEKLSVAAHYYHKKADFLNEINIKKYLEKVKEDICKNDAVIEPFFDNEKSFFIIKSKESINRKNLLPILENFFKNVNVDVEKVAEKN
jgi:hypothetical protein